MTSFEMTPEDTLKQGIPDNQGFMQQTSLITGAV